MSKGLFLEERRNEIIKLLEKNGRAEVKELAQLFAVTEDAIRKDLRHLEKQNILIKTYGGAVSSSQKAGSIPYKDRGEPNDKVPLAKAAASLIEEGDTIFVESSSITNLMFGEIKAMENVTLVTNSIHGLANMLGKVNLIHVGGNVHATDEGSYGDFALQTLEQINFDKCFLSSSGITTDFIVTTSLQENVALKKMAIAKSKKTILLASETKWNRYGTFNVSSLEEVHTVITNTADQSTLDQLRDRGIHVITVRNS
jgi:DeoR/GlpR family transcriptional regulator of sugar metabolism